MSSKLKRYRKLGKEIYYGVSALVIMTKGMEHIVSQ
jgi:hypothetical protein